MNRHDVEPHSRSRKMSIDETCMRTNIDSINEPLLQENKNRFVIFPIQYDIIWGMYKESLDNMWMAEDISFKSSNADREELEDSQLSYVMKALWYCTSWISRANENATQEFMKEIQVRSVRTSRFT
jgi:ribonucleoside-diphosphate reductase beta chain